VIIRSLAGWNKNYLLLVLLVLPTTLNVAIAAEGTTREAISTNTLRVCADPGNMPFSNESEEGFENKIIELVAAKLERPVQYTWFPQTVGFVRNTLRIRECDLISGISTSSQLVQNTNPYYHSVYTMVHRADSDIKATELSDPVFKNKRIGVVAGTPPATLLARYGLLTQITPYQLTVDTRHFSTGAQAIKDIVDGTTDVALLWGPIAGFHVQQVDTDLTIVPLLEEPKDVRLDYRVSMAVRYNETQWKRTINKILKDLRPEIDKILQQYGVPLLNDLGQLIAADS